MTTPPNTKIEQLFFEARECPEVERMAYLKTACAGDEQLFNSVRNLLSAAEGEDSLLDDGVRIDQTTASFVPAVGTVVGRYKLLQQLGEGGFGVVFLAEQTDPVTRQVALKIIKPGMDSKAVIARFEAERQALAMMDHPNIAKVLDGSCTPDGRPFFVMELVRGVSITEFCDKRRLNSNERLQLFVDVCNAVQHAHQKGIIHRDLKPSNVMITLHDGNPVVKVIDFGVARAIHQKLTDKTLFTQYGQMIGTPQYMSPEQAEMSGLDVDTRSDIYSLGVLLYELLTGSPPLTIGELKQAGYAEIKRLICERDLQKPSTRVSTTAVRQLTDIAEQRGATPEDLKRQFQGELDWVVMKTLEKDRERRYSSASDLAEDVQRYLDDEVVGARPPSFGYRAAKYVRKHRLAVATAATILVALLLSTIISTRFGYVATVARQEADDARQEATVALKKARAEQSEKERLFLTVTAQRDELQKTNRNLELQMYAYRLRRVETARAKERREIVLQRLAECPESLRGWEWQRLHSAANTPDLLGRIEAAFEPCFVPNTNQFVTLCTKDDASQLKIWDAPTLQCVAEIDVNIPELCNNAIHPNGRIAAVTTQFDVILIDLQTNREVWRKERAHEHRIDGISFGHDGKRFATVCWGGELKIWDATSNEPLQSISDLGRLRMVQYSANGRYLATGCIDGPARIWDAATGELLQEFKLSSRGVNTIRFSPDGDHLVCGSRGGSVGVRDIPTQSTRDVKGRFSSGITCVGFSPDGQTIAVSGDRSILLVDAKTGKQKASLENDQSPIWQLVFSPDGQFLTSSGGGNSKHYSTLVYDVTVADLAYGSDQRLAVNQTIPSRFTAPFSPDGRFIAAAGNNRMVEIIDAQTGQLVSCLKGHTNPITAASWSSNGSTLFTHERGGLIRAWDWLKGSKLWSTRVTTSDGRYPAHGQWYYGTMAVDSKHVFVGVGEGEIVQLDASNGTETQRRIGHAKDVNWVAITRDGKLLASASADGTVGVWKTGSFTKLQTLTGHEGNVSCVAFSPNGEHVAATSSSTAAGTIRVWHVASGKLIHTLEGPPNWTCSYSEDGRRLFSGAPGFLVVWDAESGVELQRISHYASPGVAVSPDGNTVSVAGYDLRLRSAAVVDANVIRQRRTFRKARSTVTRLTKTATKRTELRDLLEDEELTAQEREAALRRIDLIGDDPFQLHTKSWKQLLAAENIPQAAEDAQLAAELVADSAEYAMGAALGCLRMERYQDAVSTLTPHMDDGNWQIAESWRDKPDDIRSQMLAILAMANFHLNQKEIGENQLEQALDMQTADGDDSGLLREAAGLIRPSGDEDSS